MAEPQFKGHLILIMAPSGSGKGALIGHLRDTFKEEIYFAVSCTTRQMRPDEKEGDVYYYKTREEFEALIEEKAFLEWTEYGGNYYGTLKSEIIDPLKNGEIVLREVELSGIEALEKQIPQEYRTVIFIEGGSWELLQKRIKDRAPISDEELASRQKRYIEEIGSKARADIIIKNEDGKIDDAKHELENLVKNIISSHRHA